MQWGNESVGNTVFGLFSIVGDSIAGIALYGFKVLFIIVPGAIIQMIESLLGSVGNNTIEWINLDTIFFNQLPLFDINVFSMTTAEGVQLQSGNVLYDIRNNVSKWYYAIRNLCIALSLAVLVYIAVRMAISNLAEDRAKYKKMLKDWLVGFALIFVLHYLMIFIVNLNNGIVSVLDTARQRQASTTTASVAIFNTTTSSLQTSILVQAFDVTLSRGMTAAILYVMLVGMTMLFIVVYIKRFITICFLTMIAPLITVTYSIDKVGDGRAQALGKWLKEYVFNILIQPFHCIIYMLFLQNILNVINTSSGLDQIAGKAIVVMMILGFVYKAEDIVRAIFGFEAKSLSSAAMLGAAAVAQAQKRAGQAASVIGGKGGKAASGVKNAGDKAAALKNMKKPNVLPSEAKKGAGGAAGKAAGKAAGTAASSAAGSTAGAVAKKGIGAKAKDTAKKVLKNTTGKTARNIAGRAVTAALAYGMTGDANTAYGASKAYKGVKRQIDGARLGRQLDKKKDETLDAYQDYAESKGLSTAEERLAEAERLMHADLDSLTDPEERNMAEWLQNDVLAQQVVGDDKAEQTVMQQLRDYEGM